jgi:hypothetical protein
MYIEKHCFLVINGIRYNCHKVLVLVLRRSISQNNITAAMVFCKHFVKIRLKCGVFVRQIYRWVVSLKKEVIISSEPALSDISFLFQGPFPRL